MNKISGKKNNTSLINTSTNLPDVSNSVNKAVGGLNAASEFIKKFDNQYLETDLSTIQNWEVFFFFLWYTEQVLPLLSLPYDIFNSFLAAIDLGGDATADLPSKIIGVLGVIPSMIPGVGIAAAPLMNIIETIAEILPKILVTFIKIIQIGFTLSRRQWDLFYKNVVDLIPEGGDIAMLIQTNCLFIKNRLNSVNHGLHMTNKLLKDLNNDLMDIPKFKELISKNDYGSISIGCDLSDILPTEWMNSLSHRIDDLKFEFNKIQKKFKNKLAIIKNKIDSIKNKSNKKCKIIDFSDYKYSFDFNCAFNILNPEVFLSKLLDFNLVCEDMEKLYNLSYKLDDSYEYFSSFGIWPNIDNLTGSILPTLIDFKELIIANLENCCSLQNNINNLILNLDGDADKATQMLKGYMFYKTSQIKTYINKKANRYTDLIYRPLKMADDFKQTIVKSASKINNVRKNVSGKINKFKTSTSKQSNDTKISTNSVGGYKKLRTIKRKNKF